MATHSSSRGAGSDDGDDFRMSLDRTLPVAQAPEEETALDRVLTLLQGSPSDRATVKLYRKITTNPNGEYCADYSVAEFADRGLELIRSEWGPGAYFIWVYGPHPDSGKVGRLARDTINIAAPARSADVETPRSDPAADRLSEMLRLMAEQNAAILRAISERPDPAAQMRESLENMRLMREALGLNNNPAPVASSNPTEMLSQMVGAIKQLREVSEEINPAKAESDPESPMAMVGQIIDLVKTVAANPGALSALTGGRGAAPDASQGVTLPASMTSDAAPLQLAAPAQNPAPEPEPESLEMMALRGSLQGLIDLAAAGKTPAEGGEFIADTLPDDLMPYLRLPNWFEMLAHVARTVGVDVSPHAEWIKAAKVEADRLLSDDTLE